MTAAEAMRLRIGLYRIFWSTGGTSLAAVGALHDGRRWMAPCNWTSGALDVATDRWRAVKFVELIVAADGSFPLVPSFSERVMDGMLRHHWSVVLARGGKDPKVRKMAVRRAMRRRYAPITQESGDRRQMLGRLWARAWHGWRGIETP